jgi:hypothetical protein
LEALAEGLVLARKAGLDLKTVMEVVKVADFRSPLLIDNGENILKRDFSTYFALQLMLKDANLIQQFSESLSSPIPALRVVQKNLEDAVALGFGKENASAVIKALEKKAGVESILGAIALHATITTVVSRSSFSNLLVTGHGHEESCGPACRYAGSSRSRTNLWTRR